LERLRDWLLLPKSVWGSRLSNTVNRRCSSHELLLRLFGFYGAGRRLVRFNGKYMYKEYK
jgi:hypothetical protein